MKKREGHAMPDSEAKTKWGKNNMTLIGVKLHNKKDADIIAFLQEMENPAEKITKQSIIKDAIRAYMANHKEEL